jgi:hypothetical protein
MLEGKKDIIKEEKEGKRIKRRGGKDVRDLRKEAMNKGSGLKEGRKEGRRRKRRRRKEKRDER